MSKTQRIDPITAALDPRVSQVEVDQGIRRARQHLHDELDACAAYRGGLAVEWDTAHRRAGEAVKAARLRARRAYLSRVGRRIDLVALLRQSRPDGQPLWGIADPCYQGGGRAVAEVTRAGDYRLDSRYSHGGKWASSVVIEVGRKTGRGVQPGPNIPPIPPRARALLTDPKIRRRANWVGLLYQPDEWRAADPDPAIVVEWADLPGQYFALAVWGGDRAAIMEFVD